MQTASPLTPALSHAAASDAGKPGKSKRPDITRAPSSSLEGRHRCTVDAVSAADFWKVLHTF